MRIYSSVRVFLFSFFLMALCNKAFAKELETKAVVHGQNKSAAPAFIGWKLAVDAQAIDAEESESEQNLLLDNICPAVFNELNSGNDPRIDLVHFPRNLSAHTELKRIEWHELNPQENLEIIKRILAYQFKNLDDQDEPPPENDSGMARLLASHTFKEYNNRIREGFISLQFANFDVDYDGLVDRVYRVGRKLHKQEAEAPNFFAPFKMDLNTIGDWQYMANLKNAQGADTTTGFDYDGGGLGDRQLSNSEGVFLFRGRAIFYNLGVGMQVLEYRRGVGSELKENILCEFTFIGE